MKRPTHRHADGGFYALIGPQSAKMPDGEWVNGFCYQGTDEKIRWTSQTRWATRFEPLPPATDLGEETLVLQDDEGDIIAAFTFNVTEIADVRHMLIKSAEFLGRKYTNHYAQKIVETMAEMVSVGLHLRDLDLLDFMADIEAFHQKFGLEYIGKPRMLEPELFQFRSLFIKEEWDEWIEEQDGLVRALTSDDGQPDHRRIALGLHQQLDALVDLTYVVLGAAYLQFGPTVFREAWRRVQTANMAKVRCEREEDSKRGSTFDVVKPAGWTPPDHHDLVKDHAHIPYRKGSEDANPNYKGDAVKV